jgi:hypothetical protein
VLRLGFVVKEEMRCVEPSEDGDVDKVMDGKDLQIRRRLPLWKAGCWKQPRK